MSICTRKDLKTLLVWSFQFVSCAINLVGWGRAGWVGQREVGGRAGAREEGVGPGRESSEDLGKVEEGGSRREPGDGEKQWHSEGSQRRMCAGRG